MNVVNKDEAEVKEQKKKYSCIRTRQLMQIATLPIHFNHQ